MRKMILITVTAVTATTVTIAGCIATLITASIKVHGSFICATVSFINVLQRMSGYGLIMMMMVMVLMILLSIHCTNITSLGVSAAASPLQQRIQAAPVAGQTRDEQHAIHATIRHRVEIEVFCTTCKQICL